MQDHSVDHRLSSSIRRLVWILAWLAAVVPAAAQTSLRSPFWLPRGPAGGGFLEPVRIDPLDSDRVVAWTLNSGIFASFDGGGSWQALGTAPGVISFDEVVPVPGEPFQWVALATVEQGTQRPIRILRSDDGARTWRFVDAGIVPGGNYSALAVDPFAPSHLLVGRFDGRIFESPDGGDTWTEAQGTGAPGLYFDLVFSRVSPGAVMAAATSGILRSTDGGSSWDRVLDGDTFFDLSLSRGPGSGDVSAWALNRDGVFRSTDGGATWNEVPLPAQRAASLVVHPLNDETAWLETRDGLFHTEDGGVQWTLLPNRPDDARGRLAISRLADPELWNVSERGPLRSRDAGQTWQVAARGFRNRSIDRILPDPLDPEIVLAQEVSTLWRSVDGGAYWTVTLDRVAAVARSPHVPGRVFAMRINRLHRSDDGGATWTALPSFDGPGRLSVGQLWPDPHREGVLYAGSRIPGGGFGTPSSNFFVRTKDGGVTWTEVSPETLGPFSTLTPVFGPENGGGRIWLFGPTELWTSTDDGDSWSAVQPPEPLGRAALAADPARPGTLVASRNGEAFRTEDGGATWVRLGLDVPQVQSTRELFVHPADSDVLYVLLEVFDDRPFRLLTSRDAGRTWIDADLGLPGGDLWQVALDPDSPLVLYLASRGHGVFRSLDGGLTWQPLGRLRRGLPGFEGLPVIASTDPFALYLASDRGVWSLEELSRPLRGAGARLPADRVGHTQPAGVYSAAEPPE